MAVDGVDFSLPSLPLIPGDRGQFVFVLNGFGVQLFFLQHFVFEEPHSLLKVLVVEFKFVD